MSQGEARGGPGGCLGIQEGWGPSFSVTSMLCVLRGGPVTLGHPYPWRTGFSQEGERSRESTCAQETQESGLGVLRCGIPITRLAWHMPSSDSQDRGYQNGEAASVMGGCQALISRLHPTPSLHLERLTGSPL